MLFYESFVLPKKVQHCMYNNTHYCKSLATMDVHFFLALIYCCSLSFLHLCLSQWQLLSLIGHIMLRLKLIEHGKIKICIHKQTCNILFIIII